MSVATIANSESPQSNATPDNVNLDPPNSLKNELFEAPNLLGENYKESSQKDTVLKSVNIMWLTIFRA